MEALVIDENGAQAVKDFKLLSFRTLTLLADGQRIKRLKPLTSDRYSEESHYNYYYLYNRLLQRADYIMTKKEN